MAAALRTRPLAPLESVAAGGGRAGEAQEGKAEEAGEWGAGGRGRVPVWEQGTLAGLHLRHGGEEAKQNRCYCQQRGRRVRETRSRWDCGRHATCQALLRFLPLGNLLETEKRQRLYLETYRNISDISSPLIHT